MRDGHLPEERNVGADNTPCYGYCVRVISLSVGGAWSYLLEPPVHALITSWTACSLASLSRCGGRTISQSKACCDMSGGRSSLWSCARAIYVQCGTGRLCVRARCQGTSIACTASRRHMPTGFHGATESPCSGSSGPLMRHGQHRSIYCLHRMLQC